MRRALIKDGIVVNVIEYLSGADWPVPAGHTLLSAAQSEMASPGDTWDGQRFTSPAPVPHEPTTLELLEERIAALEARPASS